MPLKALLVVGLCDRFDAWVARQQPGAAEVLQSLRASRPRGPV